MFKFIKEILIDPIKEGWQEGKEELKAEEEAEKILQQQQLELANKEISLIPFEEKFVLALAAPFRAIALGRYLSLFAFDPEQPIKKPLDMYKFHQLDEKTKNDLATLLLRDFEITDGKRAKEALLSFSFLYNENIEIPPNLDKELAEQIEDFKALRENNALNPDDEEALRIVSICISAYIITSSIDLEIFSPQEGLEEIQELVSITQKKYSNWKTYGETFLVGEKILKLNNILGRKVLSSVVSTLIKDPGSPWNNVPWK